MMADATKNIKFLTSISGTDQVKQGFDGMNISAKDLQERLADLNAQVDQLKASYGSAYKEAPAMVRIDRERAIALEKLVSMDETLVEGNKKLTKGMGD